MLGMKRSELSARTGVSIATLRYYECIGILPAPKRAPNGYRMYTEDYVIQIQFIKAAQSLGYELKEIGATLQLLVRDMDIEALKELVRNKIVEIETNIREQQRLQTLLSGLLQTSDEDIQNFISSFRVSEDC
ncbi:MerR family transcriptional regulator [Paenibacillus endoradicis]|uniref:MerR family transcriptional regulator n=1 Tax=Paenibacillus endoradicis TaxID=2972487 RepID=UPI00215999EA|nr:MerR family transcriptional regulator [Paenibacillus endoradicis]MCR8656546.1 MerR family transcriptional regulator [Paenibacillus endoradicis]